MSKIVECVLNFSEGCNQNIIKDVINTVKNSSNEVQVLDVDSGMQTNRTVLTFAGEMNAVEKAAFQCIKKTTELIDMRAHKGVHPRQGCTDVCPFIPIDNVTMQECVVLAQKLGQRVGKELGMPVYLYGYAASAKERTDLAYLRKGEYEKLHEKLLIIKPDYGPCTFNELVQKTGAVCIGARDFLVAYNVNLNTKDIGIANKLAKIIRESGSTKKTADGKVISIPGLLKAVKGIGWYIQEYGIAQISFNLLNYNITPLHVLFETCVREAEKVGIRVTGGEIVGLLPAQVLIAAGKYFLQKGGSPWGVCDKELINIAIKSLGLSEIKPFQVQEKVIEYSLAAGKRRLCEMRLDDFIDTVSTSDPAPGGGSVAATAGALGVSLGMMVGALGVKKDNAANAQSGVNNDLYQIGEKITAYLEPLKKSIDLDTQAFSDILSALRLPKKTEVEQQIRHEKLQEVYKQATSVPLNVAINCAHAIKSLLEMAKLCNPNAISDVGVGALMLYASFVGALLNVEINTRSIQDKKFTKEVLDKIYNLQENTFKCKDMILSLVKETITK